MNGIETEWGLVQKPYCCCGSCHAAMEAVIGLVTEHDLAPDGIPSLTVPSAPGVAARLDLRVAHPVGHFVVTDRMSGCVG